MLERGSLYLHSKQAIKDKQEAVAIEQQRELDDTLRHRKLAVLLNMGKSRVKRAMHKYGLVARCKSKKHGCLGKASTVAPNRVRRRVTTSATEMVVSDIFEVHLAMARAYGAVLPCGSRTSVFWH